MSATLCWKPVTKEYETLPYELMTILREKHGLASGRIYSAMELSYLRGLSDAGVKGANDLIAAIEKHESVELWLEY